MGCDIHAMYERNERIGGRKDTEWFWWTNKGSPELNRDYHLFAALANVRNYGDIEPIAEPKIDLGGLDWKDPDFQTKFQEKFDGQFSSEFFAWLAWWYPDAHSASFVSLAELKEYEPTDAMHEQSRKSLSEIIDKLEALRQEAGLDDDEVRMVFFFDN